MNVTRQLCGDPHPRRPRSHQEIEAHNAAVFKARRVRAPTPDGSGEVRRTERTWMAWK